MKVYTNFDEINRDLRILKLKRNISEEEMRLRVNGLKGSTSSSIISPVSTVASIAGSVLQKALVAKLVGKLFGYKRVKEVTPETDTMKV